MPHKRYNSAQATSLLNFYCKNSQLAAFFIIDKSEAVRLLKQVTADLT